jgi:hypothetical protein
MLWYVQLSARLHAMYAESVLDAVELDLEREGVLYGSEAEPWSVSRRERGRGSTHLK